MYLAPSFILFLWSETPFFPGSERGSTLDLVVQRDLVSGLPIFRASGIKGVLRSYLELTDKSDIAINFFGSSEKIATFSFIDARILLFPVRSVDRFFVFLTSKYLLSELMNLLLLAKDFCRSIPPYYAIVTKLVKELDNTAPENFTVFDEGYIFEGYDTSVAAVRDFANWLTKFAVPDSPGYSYVINKIEQDLIIVKDDKVFREIVERGISRITRIQLDYFKKIAKEGHLFTQELLPEHTLLYSLVFCTSRNIDRKIWCYRDKFRLLFNNKILSFGGDESTGKGFLRIVLRKLW